MLSRVQFRDLRRGGYAYVKTFKLLPVLLALMVSACGTVVVDKSDPNYIKFEELCRTKAGTRIYETVDNVKGVFGVGPDTGLLKYRYEFVEYETDRTVPKRNLKYSYVTAPGLNRYTLEDADHPNCQNFYKLYAHVLKAGRELPKKFGGKCIATWPIEKVSTKYKFSRGRSKNWNDDDLGTFSERWAKFTSNDDQKIYATHFGIWYTPLNSRKGFNSRQYIGVPCHDRNSPEYFPPPITSIFKPKIKPQLR